MTNIQPNQNNQSNPENILWEVRAFKGFWKKKQTSYVGITNQRIIINDWSILITNISSIAIINKHRVSQGVYTGYNVRSGNYGSRVGVGSGNFGSKSKSIGDLVIVTPVGPDAIITSVADPEGIKDLIMSLRQGLLSSGV